MYKSNKKSNKAIFTREFLDRVTHKLNTPLTIIRGNAQLVKEFASQRKECCDLVDMLDDIDTASFDLEKEVKKLLQDISETDSKGVTKN